MQMIYTPVVFLNPSNSAEKNFTKAKDVLTFNCVTVTDLDPICCCGHSKTVLRQYGNVAPSTDMSQME